MGATLRVRITATDKFFVRGEVLGVLHAAPDAVAAASVVAQRTKQRPARAARKKEEAVKGAGTEGATVVEETAVVEVLADIELQMFH